jgi:putative DNA primase/helicase
MYGDAKNLPTEGERKAMAKWALASESRAKISDALTIAQSLPKIRVKSTDFDRDPWLLNVRNGILDLKAGTFLPHDHRALCSKIAGASYDDTSTAPWWEEFLSTIFNQDVDLIGFVQRAVGYSLTGITDSQALFFAYGAGANGKTTFFEILRLLFKDYYQKAPGELLLLKRSESVPADVARLRGVRLAVLAEIEGGRKLNESKAKDLSGGDTIVARHLYGNFFEFQPSHKVWMYGNHKPIVTGTDYGLWRRIHLIPFAITIAEDKQKPMGELLEHARREMSGILNWCIEGLVGWKHRGLAVPDVVKAATGVYREESDTVAQFIAECCNLTGQVSSSDLYEAYQTWSGTGAMSWRVFQDTLKGRGFQIRVGHYKKRFWQGVSLSVERVEQVECLL